MVVYAENIVYLYEKNEMECLSGRNRPTELTNTFEC